MAATLHSGKGDTGYTQIGKKKYSKSDALIVALSHLDALQTKITRLQYELEKKTDYWIFTITKYNITIENLCKISNQLYNYMAVPYLDAKDIHITDNSDWLCEQLAAVNMKQQTKFVLPAADSVYLAAFEARTFCRLTECAIHSVPHDESPFVNCDLFRYINILSDYLYAIAQSYVQRLLQ